ncbi:uncharacterized protein CANTADRAFT_8102 [Suhomyces tanzawaensis NRRL Y-17324]|uniref:Uncharacterized protein n=1 Tax=Suhomyces tanzawaensis NRRL Y-17324 TaxID=984487 RepID=A0A1E4SDX9_9ASCO|nr:uncharacterized protein CANTADRAFT_8102 [Suhomyces tanzawaensis NRRL Y-17324]ODV77666.1 hypothetical protein CANTADRAFT_8102 [Suhomyces tanzawaensis NRRL Y-17324]
MFRYRLSKLKASVRAKKKDEGPFVAVIENPLFVDDLILDELQRIDSSETVEVCSCDLDPEIIQHNETSKCTSNSAVQSIPEIIVSSNTGAHCSSRSEPENVHVDEASECASSWDMESIQESMGSSRAPECALISLPEGEANLKSELKGLLLHLENVKEQLYELWLTEGSNHPFYSLLDSQRLTTESEICAINSKLNAVHDQASDIHDEDQKIVQNEPDSPIVNDLALPKKSSEGSETNLKNELERLLKDQERNKVELARCTAALGTDNLIERMPEILDLKFKQRQIALQISKINSKLNAVQAFPIADNLAVSKKSSDKHEADLKKELEKEAYGPDNLMQDVLDFRRSEIELRMREINSELDAAQDLPINHRNKDQKIVQNEPASAIVNHPAYSKSSEKCETGLKNELEKLLNDLQHTEMDYVKYRDACGPGTLMQDVLDFRRAEIELRIREINSEMNAGH